MKLVVSVEGALCRINRHCLLKVERFALAAGEHWTVLGGNGTGKTTLARLLAGLRRESADYVLYAEGFDPRRDISQVSFEEQRRLWQQEQRHDISEYSPSATDIGTEVERCVRDRRPKAEQDEKFLATLFEALSLNDLRGKGIRYLSSGELRRVMLARALYSQIPGQAKLLILDDPLESLDRQSRAPITDSLLRFILPETITLRLTRRLSDILPGTTHLAVMENTEEHLSITAQGKLAAILGSEPVTRFRNHRPPPLQWPAELSIPFAPTPSSKPSAPSALSVSPTPSEPSVSSASSTSSEPSALPASSASAENAPLIELRGVSASYGERQVFKNLNWRVNKGDHVLIEGPNGCGKSTLLSLIDGENHKGYGQELYLFGRKKGSGESIWETKSRFGIVSNELHNRYIKGWRTQEVVISGFYDSVGLYDNSNPSEATQATHWLTLIGLNQKAKHYYEELSFGQQRLVLLARAMVKHPPILILDEPCVGLDDYHRQHILSLLDLIATNTPTQIIYVSHTRGEHPACVNRHLEFRPDKTSTRFSIVHKNYPDS